MTAEPIARVVADLKAGRATNLLRENPGLYELALKRCRDMVVVDATAIYRSLLAKDEPVYLYEDHPSIAPPWRSAAVCYENDHGNVIVMQASGDEVPENKRGAELWEPADPVDWARVRWVIDTCLWLGGRSDERAGPIPTCGPAHVWRWAVYDDGAPADLRWVHVVPEYPMERWDMAHLVLLQSFNFLGCRNVELVDPPRERHERKRLARLGVSPKTISVFPAGRSTRGAKREDGAGVGVPLTSVRGHFATYGLEGRGLLFGKYAGRYWIPPYAKGSKEHGESQADYRLVPIDQRLREAGHALNEAVADRIDS